MKKILMATVFATAIAFAADAAKAPAAVPAKTEAAAPAPTAEAKMATTDAKNAQQDSIATVKKAKADSFAAAKKAAEEKKMAAAPACEDNSFNPMPLVVGNIVLACLLVVGVWRSRRCVAAKAAESPTKQEPPVQPTRESEPNKSEQNVSDELQKVDASLQELKKAVQEKEKLLQMNAEMHEELVGLRNGLADAIKKPLLMGLVQIYDRLEDLVKANSNLSETGTSATKILKTVNDIKLNCLDLLYEFDVEPVEPKIGDAFNPKEHKAIKTIVTDDATKDRTISSVRQIGFVNVSNSRMLRVGSVEVYKKRE